jgi:hypothetical protein
MKVAVVAGLSAKRDMYINTCQTVCDLMNNLAVKYPGEKPNENIQTANISAYFFVLRY